MKTKSGKREKASPVKREKAKSRLSHKYSKNPKGVDETQFQPPQVPEPRDPI